jgi:hypothetical protein
VRSRRVLTRLAIGGMALLAIGVLPWVWRYVAGGTLDRNEKIVSMLVGLIGVLVAAASLRVTVLQQRQTRDAGASNQAERLNHAVEALADAVQRQWDEEARVRALRRPAPLRLQWSKTERPVAASISTIIGNAAGSGRVINVRFHGSLHEVGDKFLALPHRRLVILGEPASGKTVLAMLLALDLLGRRRSDDPVPVLLSIASWNPTLEHLHTWISRRLEEDYPALRNAAAYGPKAAEHLVVAGHVLPILDGLDEMPAGLRVSAIDGLDRAQSDRPMVITSRIEEYQEAVAASGEVLAAAAVVELQPVAVDEAISFLQAAVPSSTRWEEVFDHLRTHRTGVLAMTLSSPLMVAMARAIYTSPNRNPSELIDMASKGDQMAVERHLFDNFVVAAYEDRPAAPGQTTSAQPQWDAATARRYLAFLATHLHRRNTRDLAWWELYLASGRIVPVVATLVSGVVPGIAIGLAIWLTVGRLAGLVGGLVISLVVILLERIWTGPEPARLHVRIRGRLWEFARQDALYTAAWIVPTGLFWFWLGYAMDWEPKARLVAGLINAIVVGTLNALTTFLRRPTDSAVAMTPQTVLQSDRALALANVPLYGLATGLTIGSIASLIGGIGVAVMITVTIFTGIGLLVGLIFSILFSSWGWFIVQRLWLAGLGQLPRKLMTFLDDAHRRGILRQIGAIYQFRHAHLQAHLAGVGADSPSSRASAPDALQLGADP